MLTPQDIQNKEFDRAIIGGYDMNAVDTFLESLREDYAALYKENAVLKGKIKVLVEKVEEYRSTEDSMRMALVTAQKMGNDLMKESKEKCRIMTVEAEARAKQIVEDMKNKVSAEERRLAEVCANTDQYVAAVRRLMERQEEYLQSLKKTTNASRPKNVILSDSDRKSDAKKAPLPQPVLDLEADDDLADTATAVEINNLVSKVMSESAPKDGDAKSSQQKGGKQNPQKKPSKGGKNDDKFDFKNMQFKK